MSRDPYDGLGGYDHWKTTEPDPYEFDEPEEREEEEDLLDECALGPDGQCGNAGTEHCDFVCPMRDSELFVGSKAWREKHSKKRQKEPKLL